MLENNTEVKICVSCGLTKPIIEFSPHSNYKGKQHYASNCKVCSRKRAKQYYYNNSEKLKVKNRLYFKKYYQENKDKHFESVRKYRLSLTPEGKEQYKKKQKAWRQANAEKLKQQRKEYRKTPAGRIVRNIRKRLQKKMKGIKKLVSFSESIDKKPNELKVHIESLWLPGMLWENYGTEWHIDHIKPIAAFDLTDPVQQAQVNHYTNLQPLWAKDNLSKSDKWTDSNFN